MLPINKSTIRAAFGRSFSRVTAVQGSGHFAGFIGQYEFDNTNNGITPTFNWDQGLAGLHASALDRSRVFKRLIRSTGGRGRKPCVRRRTCTGLSPCSVKCSPTRFSGIAYNANIGTHLQTGLLNYNQVPTKYFDQFVQQYGPTQALALLTSNINSAQARAANIPIPYPSFPTQRLATRCPGAAAISAVSEHRHGRSERGQERPLLVSRDGADDGSPLLGGFDLELELHVLEAPDGLRFLLRQ